MIIIRPVTQKDLDSIERCALTAGIGMTHLPRRRDLLEKKIINSLEAFAKEVTVPKQEDYLFVLEDLEEGIVGGTCGIYAKVGASIPFYVYCVETLPPPSHRFPVPKERRLLRLISYEGGPTEVCALFLSPEFRKGGLGRLLSLSRFLFIANHPHRFDSNLIANMRGVIEKNISPFWNGLSRQFLDVEFEEIMAMRSIDESFIPDILPRYPIYVSLLPPSAQEVIGQTHANTKPAIDMLAHEGFQYIQEIDPMDGGPIIAAETRSVRTVKHNVLATVQEIISQPIKSERYILSNTSLDFRACYGTLRKVSDHSIVLSEDVAKALRVQPGDSVRYIQAK